MKKYYDKKFLIGLSIISSTIFIAIGYYIYCKNNNRNLFIGSVFTAIIIILNLYKTKEDILNPSFLYGVFWIIAAGVSTIKISIYQNEWSLKTWFIIFISYIGFYISYNIPSNKYKKLNRESINLNKLYISIVIITLLAIIGLIIEILIRREIPFFSENMNSYKTFSVTGIHYFVINVGIIPMLTILYKKIGGKKSIWKINAISILISILILSRQLLIIQISLIIISYNYLIKKIKFKNIIIILVVGLILFSSSFIARNQSNEYINYVSGILPKYSNSILVKPLIYINMNFENLNNIINNFDDYKYGHNTLFPILAFTNLKDNIDYSYKSNYLINKNMTTSTYLSDYYYDFGIIGVMIIPFILGYMYKKLYIYNKNNISIVNCIYFLMVYCIIFSFFVNWYNNTSMWFYVVTLIVIYFTSKNNIRLSM